MNSDGETEKLKLRLEQFYASCQSLNQREASIVGENLSAASDAITESINCGKSAIKERKTNCNIARLRLDITQKILDCKPFPETKALSDTAQLCIKELCDRVIAFKAIVEWKNIVLSPEDKANVVQTADLLSQSLSALRFYQCDAAESAAVAGILLQHYLNLRCNIESNSPLTKHTRKTKAATKAAKITSITETLIQIRRTAETKDNSSAQDPDWQKQIKETEKTLVKLISSLDGEEENLNARITKLESELIQIRKRAQDHQRLTKDLDEAEKTTDNNIAAINSVMTADDFNATAQLIQSALVKQVDDPEVLDLRIKGIKRLYRELLAMRHQADDLQQSALYQSLRAELNSIALLLSQANLFHKNRP